MEKQNLIDAYFEGSLTDKQNLEFQELLRSDAVFLQEFTFQKKLKIAIRAEERATLKTQFSRLHKKNNFIQYMAIAASFIILFSLGTILFLNKGVDTNAIYAEHFTEFPNISQPVVRGASEEENITDKAFEAYDNRNYKLAIALFSKANTEEGDFYKAISEMVIHQHSVAEADFAKIKRDQFRYRDHLIWYEALNFIKLDKIDKAKTNLKSLESSYYNDKAKRILSEIE